MYLSPGRGWWASNMAQGRSWWCWNTLVALDHGGGYMDRPLRSNPMTLHTQLRLDPFTFQVQPVLQGHDMQSVGDGLKAEPTCNISAPSGDSIGCYCSVAQLCSTFATSWTAGHQASLSFTISHCFAQTYVHQVRDAIQPSYPLSSPSPSTFSHSQDQVFSNESVLPVR